jgi:hypothetical protein
VERELVWKQGEVETYLEATVEQRLIEIKNETFTAGMLRGEGR